MFDVCANLVAQNNETNTFFLINYDWMSQDSLLQNTVFRQENNYSEFYFVMDRRWQRMLWNLLKVVRFRRVTSSRNEIRKLITSRFKEHYCCYYYCTNATILLLLSLLLLLLLWPILIIICNLLIFVVEINLTFAQHTAKNQTTICKLFNLFLSRLQNVPVT